MYSYEKKREISIYLAKDSMQIILQLVISPLLNGFVWLNCEIPLHYYDN